MTYQRCIANFKSTGSYRAQFFMFSNVVSLLPRNMSMENVSDNLKEAHRFLLKKLYQDNHKTEIGKRGLKILAKETIPR